ncbi:MAG: phosphatidylinositol-specific phospholipase C/glycerophosphodiester phosphodiesterase family protein, partial [Verrucomicrobiales bacterium]|nr:phosphatidylinositol-specific phospholipase C/glycerophosphodiester phosphodiesterase family protein [Verrucomicrobiales bacterium]
MLRSALLLVAALWVTSPAPAQTPLVQAHSHNDYEHARPLHDALDQGFCSIEADIYLIDGQLLVAHDREQVKRERTLQALYLDPLRERVRVHGGRVHRDGPPVTLLIDLKTEAETTYAALREVLKPYRDLLTRFTATTTDTRAITVILSGNRPTKTVEAEIERWVGIDGRVPDLTAQPVPSPHLMPLVSDAWRTQFTWNGQGAIPEAEGRKLAELVRAAHEQGRRIRFWGAADREEMWRAQHAAGVDMINTDRLAELAAYLRASAAKS